MFLKEWSCFPDCWKVSWVVTELENVGKRSVAENHCSVSLLSVFSKVFKNFRIMNLFITLKKVALAILTLIRVGFLWVRYTVGGRGGGVKLPPCLKLRRIMLGTLTLVCKYTHLCRVWKLCFSTKTPLVLLMSAPFCKKSVFFGKNSTFAWSNIMRVVLEIF